MGSTSTRASWVLSGTLVVVPARVASLLVDRFDVDELRAELEPEDREAAEVLASLSAAGRIWSAQETFPLPQKLPQVAAELPQPGNACVPAGDPSGSPVMVTPPDGWVRLEAVSSEVDVPVSTLRYRARRGLVPAVKVRGAWWLDPAVAG